jgi:cytoskeletal protein CcmA (bactofilin family)
LTGDVSAARISIEDGAFFKGGIDIRKSEPGTKSEQMAAPDTRILAESRNMSDIRPIGRSEEPKPVQS